MTTKNETPKNNFNATIGNTMLAEVLLKNEKKLEELDHERKFYENFYQFNKTTGLGKIYRQTQLKVRICIRLLNFC